MRLELIDIHLAPEYDQPANRIDAWPSGIPIEPIEALDRNAARLKG